MRKLLIVLALAIVTALSVILISYAAPRFRGETSIQPVANNLYWLATSTSAWSDIFTYNLSASGTITFLGLQSGGNCLSTNLSGVVSTSTCGGGGGVSTSTTGATRVAFWQNANTLSSDANFLWASSSQTFTITGSSTISSNVGVGTTTPNSTLQIYGNFALTSSSTLITSSIGGSALLAGACASATSTIDSTVSSSTVAFVTTPQVDLSAGFQFYSFLSLAGVVTTRVCAEVAGTPVATPYVVKIIK